MTKTQLSTVIQSLITSLATPESDSSPNELILVAHGVSGDLERLNDLKISR